MSLWLLIVLLGVIKLPLAALMLWLPLRHDEAMSTQQLSDSSDDDGGSRALPAGPLDPRPRLPGGDRSWFGSGCGQFDPCHAPSRVDPLTALRHE